MKKKKSSKSLASSNMKRNKGGENDIRDTLRVAGLFAAGVLIGTVCGLLLAPMSGAEMRGVVKEKALSLKEKTLEKAEQLKE